MPDKITYSARSPGKDYILLRTEGDYQVYMKNKNLSGMAGAFDQWLGIKDLVYVRAPTSSDEDIIKEQTENIISSKKNLQEKKQEVEMPESTVTTETKCPCTKEFKLLMWLIIIAIFIGLINYAKQ